MASRLCSAAEGRKLDSASYEVAMDPVVRLAKTESQLARVRQLFMEYAETIRRWHGEMCLVAFQEEAAHLPGAYCQANRGGLWLAGPIDAEVGCVAMRQLDDRSAEMKRLYVQTTSRRGGLGKALVEGVLLSAKSFGYDRVCLDTLPVMVAARQLYQSLGFVERTRYSEDNPKEAICMEYTLKS